MRKLLYVMITLLALSVLAKPAHAQGYSYSNIAIAGTGRPIGGANVAVCTTLATTAASVTSNFVTLTLASNPIGAGFVQGMTVRTSGFTGGDTYLNLGTFTASGLQGGATITSLTTSTITFALTHANATASTNGTVIGQGNATTPCAPLVNIYTDQTLTVLSANPVKTTGLGNYGFSISPQVIIYTQLYGPGVNTSLLPVTPPCVINGANCGGGGGGGGTNPPGFPGISNASAPYNAACDGSTDDGTANTSMINALAANGGTGFLCNNTIWTPPSSASSWTPPSVYYTIGVQGKSTIKSTWHFRALQALTCQLPIANSQNLNFVDVPVCDIFGNPTSTTPIISLDSVSGGSGPFLLDHIGVSGNTGIGINIGPSVSNARLYNVWSEPATTAGIPISITGGFGHRFSLGGYTAQSGATCLTNPSMFFHSDGNNQDPIRLLELDTTFVNVCGMHFDTVGPAMMGPIGGGLHFHDQLAENMNDCMYCFDVTGTAIQGAIFDNDVISDNTGPSPFIRVYDQTGGSGAFGDVFIRNPGAGLIFDVRPFVRSRCVVNNAFVFGHQGSVVALGLYGCNASYTSIQGGNAVFNGGGGNGTPSGVAIGSTGVGLAEPYQPVCTASNSGGSLTTGTYWVSMAYEDSQGQEGQLSSDWQAGPQTITGSSGSISCTWNQSVAGALPAVATRLFTGTTNNAPNVRYRTTTVGGPYVITGSGGTSVLPTQVNPNTANMALTDHFGAQGNNGAGGEAGSGNEFVGMTGCFAVGKQGCTGDTTPGDMQVVGSLKVSTPITGGVTTTVGTGTITIPILTALASGACASPTPSVTITGSAAATDNANGNPTEDLSSITGYAVNPGTGTLTIYPLRVTTNTVSVQVCNGTSGPITSSAAVHILVHVLR